MLGEPAQLFMDTGTKSGQIHRNTRKIIRTHIERKIGCNAECPLQRLRPRLYPLELDLLFCAAPIRPVPVTIVDQQASLGPSDAPMGNLMQSAGKKAVGKDNSMMRMLSISRQINGLAFAPYQDGIVTAAELIIEQIDKLVDIVLLLWLRSTPKINCHVSCLDPGVESSLPASRWQPIDRRD